MYFVVVDIGFEKMNFVVGIDFEKMNFVVEESIHFVDQNVILVDLAVIIVSN